MRKVESSIRGIIKKLRRGQRIVAVLMTICMVLSVMPYIGTVRVYAADETLRWGDYEYQILSGGVKITKYLGNSPIIKIPTSINGVEIWKIGDGAFSGCSSIVSVEIPDGVITIGDGAFSDCVSLNFVSIPYSMAIIGYGAFSGSWNISDIYYGGTEDTWGYISIASGIRPSGLGNATKHYNCSGIPDDIIDKINKNISTYENFITSGNIMVSHGENATITENGDLYMWGTYSSYLDLDEATIKTIDYSRPHKILGNIKQFEFGKNATFFGALTKNGDLYMWGSNSEGELGDGTNEYTLVPKIVLSNVRSFSLGGEHSAAITFDGSLYTWGDNSSGQLGDGTREHKNIPVKIMDNIKNVSLGLYHSGAIADNGDLYMWGGNNDGEIGNGEEYTVVVTPTKVLDKVQYIDLSRSSCAILETGELFLWGRHGILKKPRKIMDDVSKVYLSDDCFDVCAAIKNNGDLLIWDDTTGPTKRNDESDYGTPLNPLKNVKCVDVSEQNILAVTKSGELYSWGKNDHGQIGNGTKDPQEYPIKIFDNVRMVSVANEYCGLVTNDGVVYMWGTNTYGELGDGSIIDRVEPTLIQYNLNDNEEKRKIETYHIPKILFSIRDTTSAIWDELEGAEVSVQEFGTATSDAAGHATIDNTLDTDAMKTVQVRVHKEGFRDYFYEKDIYNKDANLLYAQTTDLIPMSRQQSGDDSNPYFSNVLLVKKNGGICDLLQTGWTYREGYESNEQNIQVNVEWNGKQPLSYELYQDNGERCVSSDGKFKVNMKNDFTPKAKVYVKATATDGTVIQDVLNLEIEGTIPAVDNGITLYEAETDESMGNDIPFLAGNTLSASMKLDKLTVSIDGDKIRIMIGCKKKIDSANGTSFDDDEWAGWKKLCETQPKDLNLSQWKNVLESIDSNYTNRISAKSDVMGFLEGKLDASGNTVVTGCIKVTTNTEIGTESQYIVGVIPVYSAFSVGINGEIQGSLSYNFTKKELEQEGTKFETKIEPKLSAEGGIGVAAVAKVGAEGSGSIPFTVNTGENNVKMSLKGGLALKVKLLNFEYTHNIAEGEWELYPANVKASKSKQASLRAFSVDKFILEDEEYTQNKWLGNFNGFKLFSLVANQDVTEKVLEQDIYEDTEIQLIDNGTVRMLLWTEHDNGRETINSSKLVYSVYDRGTDTWSAPAAVADDGTADFQPTVTYNDDKIYVAWVNVNKVLKDTDTLTDMTEACGVVMSEWTTDSGFSAPLQISEADVVSVSPQMALKQDGKPYIVYVTNSANDLMFTSGTNDIVSAVVDGDSVSRIKIVQDAGLVTSLSVNKKDGSEVSYTKDKDGSLATLEDRDIVQLSDTGSFDTNNSVMDSNAQYIVNGGKSICFWYSERAIMMQEEGEESKEIYKDDTLSDEFSLVSGKENEMAIIWTKTDEDGTKQIKGITYDAANAEWSESVQISDTDANVYQPEGVFDSDGSLVISYKKTNTQRTDLCVLTAHKNCDLSLENAYCNESDLECGSTQHIAVQVKNEGLKTASSFKVKVADTETVINEALLPGETKIVSAEYQVPDSLVYGDVKVSVEEASDHNLDNNQYTLQIGNPDLEIKVDSASYSKGNLAQIRVANMNCVDTNAVLEVRADSLDGEVIDSVPLGTIGKGEVKELEYLWCNRTVSYSSDIQCLYFNVVTDDTEKYTNNNYDFIVVGQSEETVPVTSIEITPSQAELKVDQQVQLTASISPIDATNKSLKWTTSDSNVATVNENGLVKAVGNGTVTITVEAQDDSGIKASCTLNVSMDNGEESGSSGSEGTPGTGNGGSSGSGSGGNSGTGNGGSSSSGSEGNSGTGNEGSTGSGSDTSEDNQNADNKDENGQEDDSKVKIKIQSIILSKSKASLSNANTLQLSATIIPENATNKSLKWTTSDGNVATVNENGLVKAVGNGKVTITVEAQDGSGIKASCVLDISMDNGGESTESGSEGNSETENGGSAGSGSEGSPGTGNGGNSGAESEGTSGTGNGESVDSGSNTSGNVTLDVIYYIVYFDGNGGTQLSRKKMTLLKDDCLGILPQVKRSKYNFDGWYTLKEGGKLISETDVLNQSSTLYAHWNKVKKPSKEKITKLKSNKSGQLKVAFEKKSNVIGYEISYSTSKKFAKAKTKTYSTTSTNVNIKKLKTGKKYYVKVRAYVQDSMGAKIFGTYSNVKSVKIR